MEAMYATPQLTLTLTEKWRDNEYVSMSRRHTTSLEVQTQDIFKLECVEVLGSMKGLFVRGFLLDRKSLLDDVGDARIKIPHEYGDPKLPIEALNSVLSLLAPLPVVKIGRYIRLDLFNDGEEKTIRVLLHGLSIR